MLRTTLALALATAVMLPLATKSFANEVGGLPILSTKSAADLIAQREKWGDKPSKTYKD
ncbi:MAG: hypothetical protein NW205_13090 [Hyphomicrobiaceae bacterium]|nr:hypothetical protein [Hyphomicrobiaceae bacterium]